MCACMPTLTHVRTCARECFLSVCESVSGSVCLPDSLSVCLSLELLFFVSVSLPPSLSLPLAHPLCRSLALSCIRKVDRLVWLPLRAMILTSCTVYSRSLPSEISNDQLSTPLDTVDPAMCAPVHVARTAGQDAMCWAECGGDDEPAASPVCLQVFACVSARASRCVRACACVCVFARVCVRAQQQQQQQQCANTTTTAATAATMAGASLPPRAAKAACALVPDT